MLMTSIQCAQQHLCRLHGPASSAARCSQGYAQAVLQQQVHASQNVWEIALETEVPVIKDAPLVSKHFDLNLAGRYTDYSVAGSVQTWKIGFNWRMNSQLALPRHRVRSTSARTHA